MSTEAIKSTAITNLDAVPPVTPTTGQGAPGVVKAVTGSCAVTSGVTSGSTYQLARIPTNCVVTSVKMWLDASSTTITGDVGCYYSTSTTGGTAVALQGTAVDADFFASAVALAAIVEPTEESGESGTYVGSKRVQPLWQAIGLSSDPGGNFDLVFTLTSTAGAAAVVNALVEFIL